MRSLLVLFIYVLNIFENPKSLEETKIIFLMSLYMFSMKRN